MINKQLRIAMAVGLSTLSVLVLLLSMRPVHAQPPPPDDAAKYGPAEVAATKMAQADFDTSTKEAPAEVVSGDTFTYAIAVVNSSLISDALSTTVSDTLPAGVGYVSGTLTATTGLVTPTVGGIEWSGVVSANSRVTITFAVTATALPGEVITNSAVISDATLSAPVTVTAVTRMAQPDLNDSTKDAPLEVVSGDRFTYTVAVVNSSLISDALSTTVSDTLPTDVSYVSGTLTATAGTVTPTASGIAWSGVVSASSRVTITFAVTATALPGEVVTNSAIISDAALSAPVTVTAATRMAPPDLSLSRKACSDGRLPEGEVVDYVIVIENSGPGDAIQTTLSDTIPIGTAYITSTAWASSGVVTGTATAVEWSGAVAAGEAVTVSFAVSVTASQGDAVTNTATISDAGLVVPVVVSVTKPVIPYVNFDFNKVVTPTIVEPGDALTYTLRFTNTGRYTATGASLVDFIPANTTYNGDAVASRPSLISSTAAITWTGDLVVGAGVAITFSVQVSPTFHGFITNTAIISQTYLPQPIVREVVATGIPILSINKLVTTPSDPFAPVGPGKLLAYRLKVINAGSIASGLLITDRLPLSTTFHASGGTFVTSTGVISWTPPLSLPTGASATFTFTVQVSPTVVSGTVIVNDDYRVTSAEGAWAAGGRVETDVKDPILSITKGADPNPPGANRELTYEVWVHNTGSLATGLLVSDTVPSNVTYITGGTYISPTGVVTWTWPSLAFNRSKVFTYQVAVGNLYSGTEIVNPRYDVSCAEGITATGGPLTLTIEPPIMDTSYKYSDPVAVGVGTELDFVIVLRNMGASNAISVTMTDAFTVATLSACAASSGIIIDCPGGNDPTAIWEGDIQHDQTVRITLTAKILSAAWLRETDVVNSAYITDDLLSETHVVTSVAKITDYPALVMRKTGTPNPVAPGRLITYTISVENMGRPTQGPVFLTDTVPAGTTYFDSDGYYITGTEVVTWELESLQPGDSVDPSPWLVVRVNDVPSGTFIYNDDYWVDCDQCLTETHGVTVTTLVQLPLQASKHVTPELVKAGESLTFTISVENVFGVTATQTMVSDTIPANTTYVGGSINCPSGTASGDAAILANGYFTWTGDISPYGTVDLTFQAQISPTFLFGTIINTAVISQANLVYRPLTETAVAVVSTLPILELDKAPSAYAIEPLQTLTYTLWLTNTGREATELLVTDPLPADTSYAWSDGTLVTPTNVVSWTWPILDFGQSVSFTLVVSVSNVVSGTQIVNQDYAATCFEGVSDVGAPVTTTVYIAVPATVPDVVAISPDTMLNLWPLTTTITGSDFISPTVASLDSTSLDVTWVDSTTLEAVAPAGMAPGLYDLTVTNPGLGLPSDVLTDAFTVTNQLDYFAFSPIFTQTAGVPITVTLTALDAFGWPVPDYSGTVTLTDSTGTISPTVSPTFVDGQASFTVTITGAGASVVITATDGLASGSSAPFAVVAGPFAGFSFATIPMQTANEPFTITIWVVDRYGNVTAGYTGTASLTDTTGTISPMVTGAFDGSTWSGAVTIGQLTPATVITATGGGFSGASNAFVVGNPAPVVLAVAPDTFANLSPQAVVITGTDFISPVTAFADSTALTVTVFSPTLLNAVVPAGLAPGRHDLTVVNPGPGAPSGVLTDALTVTNTLDHFTFGPVLTQTAGVSFTVIITAEDAFGWTVVGYTGSAALSDSTGTLSPTTTPTFTAGVVTASLTITRAQSDVAITAQDGVYTGTSNTFTVLPGPQARFVFGPVPTQTAGVPFTVTITAVDSFGNPVTTYNGTNVLSDTTGAIVPTVTPAFSDGTVQVAVTIIRAQSDVTISTWIEGSLFLPYYGSSDPFDVVPGPLGFIHIEPTPILTQTAGQPFTITLTVVDAYDNVVTDFNGTVVLSDTTSAITPTEVTCSSGVWEGPVTISRAHDEVTIAALESGVERGRSNAFDVVAGPLARFTFGTVLTQTVGISFTVDITAVDAFDNPVVTYTGVNVLTDMTGTITPTVTPAFVDGAVQLVVTINEVQSGVVITTTGAGRTGSSNAFDVVSGVRRIFLPLIMRNAP